MLKKILFGLFLSCAFVPAQPPPMATPPTPVLPWFCPPGGPATVLISLPTTGQVVCAMMGPGFALTANGTGNGFILTNNSPASTINFQDGETPSGTVDGTNAAFALSKAPVPASSLVVIRNGIDLTAGRDFTLSGSTVTFLAGAVPKTGDSLKARYRY